MLLVDIIDIFEAKIFFLTKRTDICARPKELSLIHNLSA